MTEQHDDGGPVHPPTMVYHAEDDVIVDCAEYCGESGETNWMAYMRAAMSNPKCYSSDPSQPAILTHDDAMQSAAQMADSAVRQQRKRWPLKEESNDG